ncbi:MAG: HAD-IA family hydrolase [Candidatus Lernaella stagnicola]|nr:HAD-IA family hydrolase [Candidatus Lernaella stagnicola]
MNLAGEYQGVLFDMDGVLLDTMGAHVEAWVAAGVELGLEIDEHEVYLREGEKGEVSARDFIKAAGLMGTKARMRALLEAKERRFAELARAPKLFPGAIEALSVCRERGLKIGLVTGTSRAEWQDIFPIELREYLDASVTGDEVLRGKPNPEPFLTSAMQLGLPPRRCVAVENAPFGIRSANAAGCFVVAVRSYLADEDLGQAAVLVDDLAAFVTLL